jgi:hypothetical protein
MGSQPAPNEAETKKATVVMDRVGAHLIQQSKASQEDNKSSSRKDVLSLLIRANTMEAKAQQMKDADVSARAFKLTLV